MQKTLQDYILEKIIGSGNYSKVYKARKQSNPNTHVAIKIVPDENLNDIALLYLEREIKLLQCVDSEHIVKLLDYFVTENQHCLVFEYCNGGDLAKFKKLEKPGPKLAREVIVQVVAGLDVLYDKKIIHRDLKLNNIFVTYPKGAQDNPIIKIGDFSFARLIKETKEAEVSLSSNVQEMSILGTPKYMAPELFNNSPYSFKADIWSLGLVAFELLCGRSCFTGKTREELIMNIAKGTYKIPKELGLSKGCLSFLHNCIQIRPESRLRWKEVKEHVFIIKECDEAFDIKEFRELNRWVNGMIIEDETNYIFNCNRTYSFFPKDKLEDEREDSCLPENQLDESENELAVSIKEVEKLFESINFTSMTESRFCGMYTIEDNSEYVNIETKHKPKHYEGEYKSKKYTRINMINEYFI